MMNIRHLLSKRGQTLVEAIVVIGVVVLLVTGLIAGTTMSLKTTRAARTRSQAVKYAQEGIEMVRAIRDDNWNTFIGYSGLWCLDSDGNFTSAAGECPTNITTSEGAFARSVRFTWNGGANRMEILVAVDYPDETNNKPVQLTTYFTQWR